MASETTLRQITDNIRDVFYITDRYFEHVIYVSPAYESIWQASREELYGDGTAWLNQVHRSDLPVVKAGMMKQAESGFYDVEYRIVLPSGQTRWIHARSYPIYGSTGQFFRVAGIAEDITESKNAVSEMHARNSAETRAKARSQALATVAHELRNPLACASLSLHRLRRTNLETSDREHIYTKLEGIVERMDQIIQDIMDMSRCESGGMVLHARPVNVVDLLQDAIEAFPPESRSHRVHLGLTYDLDPKLECSVDAPRLMQVVCNLIDNAIKFTIDGGNVGIYAGIAKNSLKIAVTDSGKGISDDMQEHLFEPFWQGKQGDKRGLGLGLPIAKSIIEAHHGRIWVESEVGHGSTFFILLPAAQPPHASGA